MRCFFAVELPQEVKREIHGLMNEYPGVNHTPLSNLHLTLKFMGEVNDVNGLIQRVNGLEQKRFKVQLDGVDAFPNQSFVKILWIGVGKGLSEVVKLGEEVNERTKSYKERRHDFTPHVTIARCKKKIDDNIFKTGFKSSIFTVSEFLLMKSVLKPSGAEHSIVERFSLI